MWTRLLLILICTFAFAGTAMADRKVALVVGNSNYRNTQPLTNPRNDAQDMAAALQALGFDVISGLDLDKQAMDTAVSKFARAASGADAAVFFYAGHGMQFKGANYLLPVDAQLEDDVSVTFEMTKVDDILSALERASGVRILILDACRNNPLAERLQTKSGARSGDVVRGLQRLEKNFGTLVAFSTQSNQVAIDGQGRNSPFTEALLKNIQTPSLEVGTLFRRVAAQVYAATRERQLPELNISLLREFYFAGSESDADTWSRIKETQKPGELNSFISNNPTSPFADLARNRLAFLTQADTERARQEAQAAIDRRSREADEQARARLALQAQTDAERARQEAQADIDRKKREAETQARVRLEAEQRETLARLAAERAQAERLEQGRLARQEAERQRLAALVPPATPPTAPAISPTTNLVPDIQRQLIRLGCYAGPITTGWSAARLRPALKSFAIERKLAEVPRTATLELLTQLQGSPGGLCGPACNGATVNADGSCQAPPQIAAPSTKPPKSRAVRNKKPRAEPVAVAPVVRHQARTPPRSRPVRADRKPASSGGCFQYNGRSYC